MSSLTCPACGRQIATSGAQEPPKTCPACGVSLLAREAVDASATSAIRDESATSAVNMAGPDDESATRPVPVDQLPTRPSPGAAPSPSPAPVAPVRGATQDLPASALPPAANPSGIASGMARGSGRSVARGVGMVALLALLVVIVVGAALAVNGDLPFLQTAASPTATATLAAPTATATTTLYKRPGLYQIRYPNGWVTTEQNSPPSVYQVTIHDTSASVSITAQQTPVFVDASVNDTNYLNGLAASTNTKAQNISQPQAITLAGQAWTQESADVSILTPGGAQYAHAVALSVNHGGWIYTIVRLAPWPDQAGAGSAFTAADQASFQPMLATFSFLG